MRKCAAHARVEWVLARPMSSLQMPEHCIDLHGQVGMPGRSVLECVPGHDMARVNDGETM